MADVLWSPQQPEHRSVFGAVLAPLIVASGTRAFADPDRSRVVMQAWILSLQDVPREVLEAGVARLLTRGVTWMPRPGDLRQACAEVQQERRADAAARARRECQVCIDSPGWVEVETDEGPAMRRCACRREVLAAIAAVGNPVAMLTAGDHDSDGADA